MAPSTRNDRSSLISIFLIFLSLLNITTSSPLPENHLEKDLVTRDPTTSITQARYEEYLTKHWRSTGRYMFYSGNSGAQIEAFRKMNPSYYWYDPIFNAHKNDHPWYSFFDYKKDLDNGETSSQALAVKTTGDVTVFGAVEWKTKGAESFFARHEIGILHDRLKNGKIKSINHMQKDATKPSQVMATEDKDGKLTWKNGFKEGDSNASGNYDVCASGSTKCDAPKPNKKDPKPDSEAPANVKPSKGMSLSVAMITNFSPHGMSVDVDHLWKFYTTKVGKPVGSCGQTDGKEIPAESTDKPQLGGSSNTPFPGGIFKLNIEGEACTYRCDGTNPGRLFCPQREIACREDSNKNQKLGSMRCGSNQFFAPSVYCDF
ncbi:hypothetical protein CC86DRAFT_413177 [Ophiobolus disseminans]|uniref:Uncharacterized protein n=1 Tax=Ophiobolus disseminans TaxID=1469910 RepID=A0A6A6ZEI5_9PLEO|nr:hypothetical protein CC86DRAFT_413177 [Ophiobolus disseminans]